MQRDKSVLVLAGTTLYIFWLVALSLGVVVYRRCTRWLPHSKAGSTKPDGEHQTAKEVVP